jgi:hypothetical protein
MGAVIEGLIRQIKGDPTSCQSEQDFHDAQFGRKKLNTPEHRWLIAPVLVRNARTSAVDQVDGVQVSSGRPNANRNGTAATAARGNGNAS